MKRKILVLLMGMVMGMTMLTACGAGDKKADNTKQTQSETNKQDVDREDYEDEDEDYDDEDGEERRNKSDKGYDTEDELVCDFEDWIAGKISDEQWARGYDPILEASFRIGFSEIGNGDIADCKRCIEELQKDDSEMIDYIREKRDEYLDYDLMTRIAEKKKEFQSYGDVFHKCKGNYSLYNFISATYTIPDQNVKEVTLYMLEYDERYYWVAMESE